MVGRNYAEYDIQAAVMEHYRVRGAPGTFVFHPPMNARSAREAVRLRRLGARAGVPDLCFIQAGRALFLELKTSTGRLSPEQRQCHEELRSAGAVVIAAYGIDHAIEILETWGVLLRAIHHP